MLGHLVKRLPLSSPTSTLARRMTSEVLPGSKNPINILVYCDDDEETFFEAKDHLNSFLKPDQAPIMHLKKASVLDSVWISSCRMLYVRKLNSELEDGEGVALYPKFTHA